MRVNQLSEHEFQSTMVSRMTEVTESAEALVDIWPYVFDLTKEKVVLDYVYNNRLVEKVYKNELNTFEHILLPASNQNVFIVIVIDLNLATIKGHYSLDLNKEYGISNPNASN